MSPTPRDSVRSRMTFRTGNRCGGVLPRGVCGSGSLRKQRGRCPHGLSNAPDQVPQATREARAYRAPHGSRCQGDLLPGHGRPLCVNGRCDSHLQYPESCRRQLPCSEKLSAQCRVPEEDRLRRPSPRAALLPLSNRPCRSLR
jgi:hypothetical protein